MVNKKVDFCIQFKKPNTGHNLFKSGIALEWIL